MSYTAFQRKPPKGRCYSVRELCVLLGSVRTPLRADKLTRTIHTLSRQVPGGDVHCKRTRVRLPDGREFDSYVIDDIGAFAPPSVAGERRALSRPLCGLENSTD